MARSPIRDWMPFEIDPFFSSPSVRKMRDFQVGWYVNLLLRAWQQEPPCYLPDDQDELMTLAGVTSEKSWKEHSALVLGKFEPTGDGHRVNRRQLEIYEEKIGIHAKNKENGFKGGRPKKTETEPNGNRTVSESSSSISEVVVDVVSKEKLELPAGIPEKAWMAWEEMRRGIKPKLTNEGRKRLFIKLAHLKEQGYDLELVIYESVLRGWRSFFPVEGEKKLVSGECDKHKGMGVTDHGSCAGCYYGWEK